MSAEYEEQPFHLDDGADEIVAYSPRRAVRPAARLDDIVKAPAGGRMAHMPASDRGLREFVLIRNQSGVVKMALGHVGVYRAMVKASWRKRLDRTADAGVTVGEIADVGGFDPDAIRDIIRSLVRNRAATAKVVHIGYQGTRALYYPSPRGEEALAIAEVVGQGSLVQVGRPVNAWKGRNMTEPPNLFQIAHIATRGLAPETY